MTPATLTVRLFSGSFAIFFFYVFSTVTLRDREYKYPRSPPPPLCPVRCDWRRQLLLVRAISTLATPKTARSLSGPSCFPARSGKKKKNDPSKLVWNPPASTDRLAIFTERGDREDRRDYEESSASRGPEVRRDYEESSASRGPTSRGLVGLPL